MSGNDASLYLCSKCYRRCRWSELSRGEHRCHQCRLPIRDCVICDRKFEPRDPSGVYCKRCDFHLVQNAASTPQPISKLDLKLNEVLQPETEREPLPEEQPQPDLFEAPREHSMCQRWRDIIKSAGLEHAYSFN